MIIAPYNISTDKEKLQIEVIQNFLTNSYWASGITLARVEKRIENSLCFGVYFEKQQVGFARIITDYDSFAYLCDVFIVEEHRGKGLSKVLMTYILAHEELQGLRRWLLATKDAHGLYQRFDFTPLQAPGRWLEKFQGM